MAEDKKCEKELPSDASDDHRNMAKPFYPSNL